MSINGMDESIGISVPKINPSGVIKPNTISKIQEVLDLIRDCLNKVINAIATGS